MNNRVEERYKPKTITYDDTEMTKVINFQDYHFIYKDSLGRWHETTNPEFIAKHQTCRAMKRDAQPLKDLLHRLNNPEEG